MSRKLRDRLFKRNRPQVRPFNLYDGDVYHKDLGILWASYKRKPFDSIPSEMEETEFIEYVATLFTQAEVYLVEDVSKAFNEKGPVVLIWIASDGWEYDPHIEFMAWATNRNKLASLVSFFQWIRFKRALGLCRIEAFKESAPLFNKCVEYGVLKFSGCLKAIDPRGTLYVFYIKGKNYVSEIKGQGQTRWADGQVR